MEDYDEIREMHKPHKIKRLFVGESRPKGNVFFYHADSDLYKYTKKAFEEAYALPFSLQSFMKEGNWLYDVCDEPVNDLPSGLRREKIRARIPQLIKVIKELEPDSIIVVKKGELKQEVYGLLSAEGYYLGRNLFFLPFPNNGHQLEYKLELIKILKLQSR